ncbi:hypothetical protein ZHAS_00008345 [Anopheles sinensis]|uniref:Uncharacterized protein n=1 Tax=Anopheles sinensis TaxID=74873 RepID=A0A084VS78_ANOSI|nr:hypothetical protein ZHAS_00008345 [Anopheles sinensis]
MTHAVNAPFDADGEVMRHPFSPCEDTPVVPARNSRRKAESLTFAAGVTVKVNQCVIISRTEPASEAWLPD